MPKWSELRKIHGEMRNNRVYCPECLEWCYLIGGAFIYEGSFFYKTKCQNEECLQFDKMFRVMCVETYYALREDLRDKNEKKTD